MRKPITIIIAATALAATCIAPAAQASTGNDMHSNPAAAVAGGSQAGLDGFWAWQSGAVHDITSDSARIPITFNKRWEKTWGPGTIGVEVYRPDAKDPGWRANGMKEVLFTNADESYDAQVPDRLALHPNTTYTYRVFVEYKFTRYYAAEGTFTTK